MGETRDRVILPYEYCRSDYFIVAVCLLSGNDCVNTSFLVYYCCDEIPNSKDEFASNLVRRRPAVCEECQGCNSNMRKVILFLVSCLPQKAEAVASELASDVFRLVTDDAVLRRP